MNILNVFQYFKSIFVLIEKKGWAGRDVDQYLDS